MRWDMFEVCSWSLSDIWRRHHSPRQESTFSAIERYYEFIMSIMCLELSSKKNGCSDKALHPSPVLSRPVALKISLLYVVINVTCIWDSNASIGIDFYWKAAKVAKTFKIVVVLSYQTFIWHSTHSVYSAVHSAPILRRNGVTFSNVKPRKQYCYTAAFSRAKYTHLVENTNFETQRG